MNAGGTAWCIYKLNQFYPPDAAPRWQDLPVTLVYPYLVGVESVLDSGVVTVAVDGEGGYLVEQDQLFETREAAILAYIDAKVQQLVDRLDHHNLRRMTNCTAGGFMMSPGQMYWTCLRISDDPKKRMVLIAPYRVQIEDIVSSGPDGIVRVYDGQARGRTVFARHLYDSFERASGVYKATVDLCESLRADLHKRLDNEFDALCAGASNQVVNAIAAFLPV